MNQDYIVLRLPDSTSGGAHGIELVSLNTLTRASSQNSLTPLVSIAKGIDDREAAERQRESPGLHMIPALPMSLIEPARRHDLHSTPESVVSWGIEAVGALDTEATGKGVKVAILDTGIDCHHPAFGDADLQEKLKFKNFTEDEDEDADGHGTHCAGTIFGRDVGGVRIGIARGITDVCVGKVIGKNGGTTATIVDAISWARQCGANIISASLGVDFVGYQNTLVTTYGMDPREATSRALAGYRANLRLFDTLSRLLNPEGLSRDGTLLVIAGGNESDRPRFSITTGPPATAEFAISVGALEKEEGGDGSVKVARFSNSDVSIAAPGVEILSAKAGEGGGLTTMSGTSMAAPHVVGVAALWAEAWVSEGVDTKYLSATLLGQAKRLRGLTKVDVGAGLVQSP